MSMLENIRTEIAYKCDLCGELFNSPDDVQNHIQDIHVKSVSNDEFGPWIMGTNTPAEDREQERAI
jgi:hypothetical protein